MHEKPTYEELERRVNELERNEAEYKYTEKVLATSEKRFREFFHNNPACCFTFDSRGIIQDWNRACVELYGWTAKQAIGKSMLSLMVQKKNLAQTEKNIQDLFKGKSFEALEFEDLRADGSLCNVLVSEYPITDDNSRVILGLSAELDITERKLVEKAIRESEEKYRDLAASLPQIVYEADLTDCVTFVNRTGLDLFGYSQEDFDEGLNTLQMISPEDRDRALTNTQIIMSGKKLGGIEYTATKKDGTEFPVVVHSRCFMKDDLPVGVRGLIIDLTKVKELEADLQQRAMIIDQSTETIVITNTEGLITYVNPAFEKNTGYSREEAIGKNPRILQSGLHDNMFYRELWQTITSGKTWSGHFVNLKKDGSQYAEEATISPVLSGTGQITNYVAVKHDISDKLHLEAQLQQAQKMEAIGNLAGGIAHDFNNILSPIFGYTEMLLLDAPDDSELRRGLTRILAGANTAKNLVNQILSFSRESEHERKPLKVQSIIREDLELVRSSLPVSIDICKDISSDCGPVLADPTQISQVIMNLCTNAYHAMEGTAGILSVALKEVGLTTENITSPGMAPGQYVHLVVGDTGSGMTPSTISRIFDPYFTTKGKEKGTGLGLAIIHGIVKSHDGHIHVYSEPGKGTEFHVYLPVIEALEEAAQVETQLIAKGNECILLVEDKKDVIDIEQQLLEFLGYQVTSRISSLDALEVFSANPDKFDLVMTDLSMPNMTGDELAGELTKIRPGIPIVLCTGFSEGMSEARAATLGIKGVIMKPVTIKYLSRVIRNVLDNCSKFASSY